MKVEALNAAEAKKAQRGEAFTAKCMWFAGCRHAATDLAPHPVLGDVPVCATHLAFATERTAR